MGLDYVLAINNTLSNNRASNNLQYGFKILDSSHDNNLTHNVAINNSLHGIIIGSSSSSTLIYHNFMLDNNMNGVQGSDSSTSTSWTNGTHGNFWNDYTGIDTNGDGIGETNYTLDGTTIANDTRPLVSNLNITPVIDFSYTEGTISSIIAWNTTSHLLPATFEILQDNAVMTSGSWSNGQPITVDAGGLGPGIHNFTLIARDISMTEAIDIVLVDVLDSTSPLLTGLANLEFEVGTTGHSLSASATDAHPDSYTVYLNGTLNQTGSWSSTLPITIDLDALALSVGLHNITLAVNDTSGNSASQIALVTVNPISTPTTTPTTTTDTTTTPTTMTVTSTTDEPIITTSTFPILPSMAVFFLISLMFLYRRRKI